MKFFSARPEQYVPTRAGCSGYMNSGLCYDVSFHAFAVSTSCDFENLHIFVNWADPKSKLQTKNFKIKIPGWIQNVSQLDIGNGSINYNTFENGMFNRRQCNLLFAQWNVCFLNVLASNLVTVKLCGVMFSNLVFKNVSDEFCISFWSKSLFIKICN